jgi:hypothetical protein
MSTYTTIVAIHGSIGAFALLTFWLAAFLRKGSPMHRRTGQIYLLAMTGIILTAMPMAWHAHASGKTVTAAFLAYLVVITAAGVWGAWRAVRDRHDVVRFTGPVYVGLGALSLLSGLGVLVLGYRVGSPLLMGFSAVGLLAGYQAFDRRLHRARLAAQPRWWLEAHYTGMLGNGIATHIAFLAIGLPRLMPSISGGALNYVAWFGPVVVAVIAKFWIDRRWKSKSKSKPKPAAPLLATTN